MSFDPYHYSNGPSIQTRHGNDTPAIPIFRSTRDYVRGGANCTRTQFPLTIAYSITVHKSQGMTVDRAVLNMNAKKLTVGLRYAAVLRVKTLGGLLFEEPFDYQRIQPKNTSPLLLMRQACSRSEV